MTSGFRINTAADDAAGLATSEFLKAQIRSYTVAERNAADGISMAQLADGALGELHDVLGRMRELAMQASNGGITDDVRGYLQSEFGALSSEIGRIQQSTSFNGNSLIGSAATALVSFQVGLNDASYDQINVTFNGLDLSNVIAATIVDQSNALTSLSVIDGSVAQVSRSRSEFGASMNKLEVATNNILTMRSNITAANSRIRDTDYAEASAKLARTQVLSQASIAILAQSTQLPKLAFALISGG